MKTEKNPTRKAGDVKVVNALASIHKKLDEIAPNGTIHCKMNTRKNGAKFVFENNGIEAVFQIRKGGVR